MHTAGFEGEDLMAQQDKPPETGLYNAAMAMAFFRAAGKPEATRYSLRTKRAIACSCSATRCTCC
jgi:hypothetical protein